MKSRLTNRIPLTRLLINNDNYYPPRLFHRVSERACLSTGLQLHENNHLFLLLFFGWSLLVATSKFFLPIVIKFNTKNFR